MLTAHAAATATARPEVPSTPFAVDVAAFRCAANAATPSRCTRPSSPERHAEMLLLHEVLARAQCSDRSTDSRSDRLALSEAARSRQRHLRAARAHRRLEVALRKLERAAQEAERLDAVASASA